jgi:predicted outer membrane repeat protein
MRMNKVLAGLFSLGLILSPLNVYADGSVYATDASGNNYMSIDDAWNAACNGADITMHQDWTISSRLVVGENQSVTIEMNGYKIDRGLGGSRTYGGEVIYLSQGSSLTLNGDPDSNTVFNIYGFNEDVDVSDETVTSGGLITGGASSDGAGGIHMKKGSSLVLNHVAISGNLSQTDTVSDGGGINMNDDNCTVTMNDSIISYNAADKGGGIRVCGENANIVMNNSSSIEHNFAEKYGGGIYSGKDATYVTMNTNSSISYNCAYGNGGGVNFNNPYCQIYSPDNSASISNNKSSNDGAGLYVAETYRGNTARVEGVTFESNGGENNGGAILSLGEDFSIKNCAFRKNSAVNGGAIYMNAENNTISNCTFEENSATKEGGAIYNNEDDTTLQDLTIIKNYAEKAGGGVYDYYTVNITIQGKMIIKDNTRGGGYADDLMLDYVWYNFPYVMGEVSSDSCVGIRTGSNGSSQFGKKITSDGGKEFFLDDSDGYHIKYENNKLYRESGSLLGSIFGNANVGIAVIVMGSICMIGVICLVMHKKKTTNN